MPSFGRTVTHPEYNTEVSVYVEFEEDFEIDVNEFYREMDNDEKTEMVELLQDGGYITNEGFSTDDWDDFWDALPLENRAKLVEHIRDDSDDGTIPEYLVPTVNDFWCRSSPDTRRELRELVVDFYQLVPKPADTNSRLPTLASQLLDAIAALPDDELFGLPDSYLLTLKARIGASTDVDPTLRQILANLEPSQPLDPSLLKEMRLLAGSTSNA